MIKNFDSIKNQLNELAPIINSFKSESVQLKIVEIIFGDAVIEKEIVKVDTKPTAHLKPKKRKIKPSSENNNQPKSKRKKGQISLLNELIEEGYFSRKRTVNEIVIYCSTNKASTIKSKDYASALTRYIRDGKLKREKNESGQYEYFAK